MAEALCGRCSVTADRLMGTWKPGEGLERLRVTQAHRKVPASRRRWLAGPCGSRAPAHRPVLPGRGEASRLEQADGSGRLTESDALAMSRRLPARGSCHPWGDAKCPPQEERAGFKSYRPTLTDPVCGVEKILKNCLNSALISIKAPKDPDEMFVLPRTGSWLLEQESQGAPPEQRPPKGSPHLVKGGVP